VYTYFRKYPYGYTYNLADILDDAERLSFPNPRNFKDVDGCSAFLT